LIFIYIQRLNFSYFACISLSVINRDGNCLFIAIFLVLFGHENASSEIRLKTFFELFDNAAFYEHIHVKYFIPDVSPSLASAIRQCTQIGSYSCTWTMHAASTVIGKPIKSVYPVVNGPADMNIKILNTTFKPRGSRSRHDITVMWSGGNTIGAFWKAHSGSHVILFPLYPIRWNVRPSILMTTNNSHP
jgi:hypothetical protein